MVDARRFLLAGLAVAAVEAVLGVVALPTGLAPFLFACAAATVAVAVGGRRLIARPRDDEDDDGQDGGPGGGPDDPPPPPWWPEFEDAFRAHVHAQRRRPPARR